MWLRASRTSALAWASKFRSVTKTESHENIPLIRRKEWDLVRIKHSDALDGVLESLGSQLVPPEFHQMTSDSSLFGSQHSEDEIETTKPVAATSPLRSPSSTVRNVQKEKAYTERSTWKTLRDFVDDQAIEDVLEIVENDRTALDVSTSSRIVLSLFTSGRTLSEKRTTILKY